MERNKEWEEALEREFLENYDTHSDALFRHCLIRIRDRELARDIVQETFSRAWLHIRKGGKVAYMRAFLYKIANNLIVDSTRKKRSYSLDVLLDDEGVEFADETLRDPADIPASREAMKMLRSLDEMYRTVVTMRFIDEMSPKEIAATLGVSENVVSVRIHRGLARLRHLMDQKPAGA